MHRLIYKNASKYIFKRGGIYYFIRRIPYDVRPFYVSNRISKGLRTSSNVHEELPCPHHTFKRPHSEHRNNYSVIMDYNGEANVSCNPDGLLVGQRK